MTDDRCGAVRGEKGEGRRGAQEKVLLPFTSTSITNHFTGRCQPACLPAR